MKRFDVVVAGVGGMGGAAIYHLASRGVRVLGLEQYDIPHAMGSSHGVNRIIRMAYFENPSYVPLLRRAYELWRELEQVSGERILEITGGLDAAPESDRVFQGSLESCRQHGLAHEVLTATEVSTRFPGYRLPPSHMAVFQPDGGYVMSERAIVAHVEAALASGAEVHGREQILDWEPRGGGVVVTTDRDRYTADKIVFTAGAWSGGLVRELSPLALPERQVLGWFQPLKPDLFQPATFPIFNLEVDEGHFYGFPVETIPGFKIGLYHHLRQLVDPASMDREANSRDEEVLRTAVERYFPEASGPVLSLKTCMFTNSPDEHFIVDVHPELDQVVVAAGFSGHGFKFASVIGEILADLAIDGGTRHEIGLLSMRRFVS
ncbi:MAG TPA: N-methyl-L-tryptophan oxidase [Acidimicrobiia bacterium]|nr:N-methyl-L-tryptophan oxidase [Acidimicrobiia bacterium]